MKRLPTDQQILRCIFEMYANDYPGAKNGNGGGENDPYVPVNLHHVAGHLNCSPEIIFGRLYYHLNEKHGYKREEGVKVSLFELNFRGNGHCVQFPLLTSVLAELDDDHRRSTWAFVVSVIALVLSLAGIVAQVLTAK